MSDKENKNNRFDVVYEEAVKRLLRNGKMTPADLREIAKTYPATTHEPSIDEINYRIASRHPEFLLEPVRVVGDVKSAVRSLDRYLAQRGLSIDFNPEQNELVRFATDATADTLTRLDRKLKKLVRV